MKLSMNEATALKCKGTTLEQDLALCEKYGYDMIEIRTMDCLKNYLAAHSIDELAEYFAAHPVKPWAFNTLEYFNNLPDDDYKETLRKLREMCEWGKKIGCKTVITVPTVGLKKVTRQVIRKSTLECLKEMGEICGEADMRLSVEFLGHPEASINDFGEAYDIIQELDMEERRPDARLLPFPRHAFESRGPRTGRWQEDFHRPPQRHGGLPVRCPAR